MRCSSRWAGELISRRHAVIDRAIQFSANSKIHRQRLTLLDTLLSQGMTVLFLFRRPASGVITTP
jgi:hypothetical protein